MGAVSDLGGWTVYCNVTGCDEAIEEESGDLDRAYAYARRLGWKIKGPHAECPIH